MSDRWSVYGRMFAYLARYPRELLLAYGGVLFATAFTLAIPPIIKDAIDRGLAAGNARALFVAAGVILAIAFVRAAAGYARVRYGFWLSYRVAYDLRNAFYESVQRLPFSFHDRARTGDLMSRATADISETERFIGFGLSELVATVLLILGVVGAMLWLDLRLALLALIPFPVLLVATVRFGGTVRPMFKGMQAQMGVLSSTMQESMTGIRVVKAFAREPYEFEKFDRDNEKWYGLRVDLIRVWADNWPLFIFILSVSILLLLWFGGPRVMVGELTIGTIFAMVSYVLLLNGPVQRLGFLVNLAATSGATSSRVFEIMDTPNEITERAEARDLGRTRGEVVFEKVSFAYRESERVLAAVSFRARPGETIALVGPTGSGKTTIINLIPRFYNPTAGVVRVDGVDIQDVTLESLRRNIGIVLQDPFLFSATVAENIAYGQPDAPRDMIEAAARAAHAHVFIMGFPDGYDTRVGERGVTLSGGQKQRVAIARALLTDPRILILDDSTSSVDTETEHLIQLALAELMKGRTTFVIAQRLLTLKNADCILVLDGGRIVERGTHTELLTRDGLYRQIYDLQLKDQEVFAALQERLATDGGLRTAVGGRTRP
ncbi:MAG: ABC transporter ATP-binding protein [Anaerolineales bacterium]